MVISEKSIYSIDHTDGLFTITVGRETFYYNHANAAIECVHQKTGVGIIDIVNSMTNTDTYRLIDHELYRGKVKSWAEKQY